MTDKRSDAAGFWQGVWLVVRATLMGLGVMWIVLMATDQLREVIAACYR